MGLGLPATGTLSYNGYTFSSAVNTEVRLRPHYDDANRTVIYNEYTFTVRDYIESSTSTDSELASIRKQLTTPGQPFHYDAKGLGTAITVNSGSVWDVCWGPRPLGMQYRPIGNNLGGIITWTCVVCIPDCTSAKYRGAVPMAWNYDVNWHVTDEGMTTRTVTGYIEMPLTRYSGRSLAGSAHDLQSQFYPEVPEGFARSQIWSLSNDRRRLNFVLTDTQLDAPYPEDIVKASVRQTLDSGDDYGFFQWRGSIGGTLITAPGVSKAKVWEKILQIIATRIGGGGAAKALGVLQAGGAAAAVAAGGAAAGIAAGLAKAAKDKSTVMMTGMTVSEDCYGRTTEFTVRFIVIGATIAAVMAKTNMWKPLGGDFKKWKTSMKVVHRAGGAAEMKFDKQDDFVIDLCMSGSGPATGGAGNQGGGGGKGAKDEGNKGPQVAKGQDAGGIKGGPKEERVDPEVSWLVYSCLIESDEDARKIVHKPVNQAKKAKKTTSVGFIGGKKKKGETKQLAQLTTDLQREWAGEVQDLIQSATAPLVRVRLIGYAERVGYSITPPSLIDTGDGSTVTELNRRVNTTIVGAIEGLPIFRCEWYIEYNINKLNADGTMDAPPNLAIGTVLTES